LHPSVQATLADYFVRQVKESNKQYIIETHSEYLLNRFRLSIVKGEIEPSDVSAYYFENSKDGSKSHQIEFKKNGQIEGAPKGFFDTYMMDVLDIALHAEG
jgi:predicted ATPase